MKRSLSRLRLLLALLAIVAASTALLQGMQSLATETARGLVTATMAAAPPRDASVRIETGLGDQSSRDAMSAFLDDRLAGLPVTIHASLAAGAVDSDAGPLLVQSDAELEEFAALSAGTWARQPGDGVLQVRAAAASGLDVGDTVRFGDMIEVRIVGLWEPVDARSTHWFAEPGAASGNDDGDLGPLMVDAETLSSLPAPASARWTVVPTALAPADLAPVQVALGALETDIDRSGLVVRSLAVEGGLGQTIRDLRSSLDASARLAAVPQALLIAVSLVTLTRIADLLWTVRRQETTLLRARGTSTGRLVGTALLEAFPIAVLGGAAGLLVPGSVALISVLAGAAALVVLVAAAMQGVRGAVTTVASRRTRAIATSAGAIVVVTAGVSLWQFLLYTNVPGANPFGSLAPALGVLALAILAVAVVPPAFRAIERAAAGRVELAPSLAVRHLARDAAVHATSVLLIALSVGGATLAAGYAGSALAAQRQSEQVSHGGDVRVRLDTRPGVDDTSGYISIDDYTDVTGVQTALPAVVTEARIGDTQLDLVASSPGRETVLPAGTTSLAVSIDAPGRGETLAISAWLADENGQAVRVQGETADDIPVPDGSWSLLAIEATVGGIAGRTSVPVVITSVTAGGTELLPSERTVRLTVRAPTARAMVAEGQDGPLEVVLSDAASRRLTAPPGSTVTLALPAIGATVDAVVLATVPAVNGAGTGDIEGSLAVQADLAALVDYLLRTGQRVPQPNEIWVSTSLPDLVADEVAVIPRFPAAITERSPGTGIAGASTAVFVLGSLGAALLAVVGVAAVAGSLGRERGADRTVLRALGLGDRAAARIRFAEFSLATAAAAVLGLAAGLVATAIYVPTLARTPTVSLDPAVLSIALLVIVGCVLVGARAGRSAR